MPGQNKSPRIGRLDTLGHIRGEMARLYRAARRNELDIQDATRLVYILRTIGEVIVASEIEKRVDEIETGRTAGIGIKNFQQLKRVA